jgi:hypothetical protein
MLTRLRFALFAAAMAACSSSGSDKPDAENPLKCADETTSSALSFDGSTGYASAGHHDELGLARFTLEAWVRRTGDGTTATTGAGGLRLVPLMTKGLGEGDKSNIDCNYAFGLWGDVLGADFEDMATGANHPVMGKTAITRDQWHHVAATFDGNTWRLYVDGALDAEAPAAAMPRADSVHAFALGTAMASDGMPHGFYAGDLDEARVWNYARSVDEIKDSMYRTVATGDGLVARWSVDGDETFPLTTTGTTAVAEGMKLDHGAAPVVATIEPGDNAVSGPDVKLDVGLELAARGPVDVTYHVRELTPADDFTIVVMPDTQIYTIEGRNLEKYFYDQTKWIRDHRAEYNIVGVIHNGDVINNEPQLYQWNVADKAMKRLETAEPGLPDGMPYGVGVGNHDNKLIGDNKALDTTKFNQFFGVSRFAGRSYYGGHYGTKNDHSWVTFSAGGMDFVVVNIMYELEPDPAAIAWARSIFQMHRESFGILNTHYLLGASGKFSAQAKMIYEALKDLPNVQMMTGGHVSAESRRIDKFEDHVVHSMLADYQGRTDGGAGYMRIWEFSPASGTVSVRSYSPTLDKYETDADSEFTLDVDLRGAGGPFDSHEVLGVAPEAASTTLSLAAGKTYEWYADVNSCGSKTTTPLYRFTTMASARAARELGGTLDQPPGRERTKRVTSGPVDSHPDDPALAD